MTIRVALFGTESTGKTTLARRLADVFAAPWAEEYVRSFWHRRDGDIRVEDLATIARGQIDNEARAAARAGQLVVCDTELITNTLWADLLFPGQCPAWVRAAAERRSRHYALYLLCDTDIDFVDDGQRCFPAPAERERCRRIWRGALVERDLPFVDIRGPLPQRLNTAISAIRHATRVAPPRSHGR
ncbi:ATP-binding protein [Salinisphaera sp.]|uniref:ATP-binding protein n=1 Tax=Salinisphaera sp. TaxID=1914330 RepID=UPI002D77661E|nr:ATP-binding protein [Salinisphaera sp.]HET7314592.1 ATP-binding protein [Salinisphaera sp.]